MGIWAMSQIGHTERVGSLCADNGVRFRTDGGDVVKVALAYQIH